MKGNEEETERRGRVRDRRELGRSMMLCISYFLQYVDFYFQDPHDAEIH